MAISDGYLKKLRERAKKSRVRTSHQFVGLEIARKLGDNKHRALYMKLAKRGNPAKLQWLAADIASREGIKQKGAYFMKVLFESEKDAKKWLAREKKSKRSKKDTGAKKRKQGRLFPINARKKS